MSVVEGVRSLGSAALRRGLARIPVSISVAPAGSLARNLAADVAVAVGMGLTTALVATLLPAAARRGGVDAIGLALLTAAPFLAMVLSVLAGRIGPRTPRSLALLRAIGSLLLVAVLLDPSAPAIALISVVFWASITFGQPFQTMLWGQMYPESSRGRLIGIVGTGRAAAAGIGVLAGGLLADRIGGLEVVAVAGLLGLAFGASAIAIRVPGPGPVPSYSVRGSLRAIAARPYLRRATLGQALLGGGLIAAGPLLAFVQVDRLSLSLTDVAMVGVLTSVATTISYVGFGTLVDRRGAISAHALGAAFGVLSLVLFAFAPSLPILWLAALAAGLSNAGVEMGIQGVIAEQTPLEDRSAAMAGWGALMGLRGMVAPFLLAGLLAAGIVDLTSGLLLAAGVSAAGLVIFVGMVRSDAVEPGAPGRWRVSRAHVAGWSRRAASRARAVSRRLAQA